PTIMRPCGSAIRGKASPCSRMPGDIAVRTRVVSISMRALRSAFSMMSSVTGSMATFLNGVSFAWMIVAPILLSLGRIDHDVPEPVDCADVTGFDEGRCVHLHDDRRTWDVVAGPQLGTVIDSPVLHAATHPPLVVADLRPGRVAVADSQFDGRQFRRMAHGDRPKVHQFMFRLHV